jgi:hypothetical protein
MPGTGHAREAYRNVTKIIIALLAAVMYNRAAFELCGTLQFPELPANQRDLPAEVQRVYQRTSKEKGTKQHVWKQEQ